MSDKKSKLGRILLILTTTTAIAAIVFSVILWRTMDHFASNYSKDTAAIYSLDINPSVEIGVDLQREVIEIRSLNEEGKQLLGQVNCMGLALGDCIDRLIAKAVELGYLDAQDENYVLLSEIMIFGQFATMQGEFEAMADQSPAQLIFLQGSLQQREDADLKGISTGKEIYQEKAREIGVEITDSDLAGKSITELICNTYTSTRRIFDLDVQYPAPVFTATQQEGYIEIQWEKIENPELCGVKIVLSRNDPDPSYPDNGYLAYITDKTQTSFRADNSTGYHNGDFGDFLVDQDEYYLNITVLYQNGSASGKAIPVTFTAKTVESTPPTAAPSPTSPAVPTPKPTASTPAGVSKITGTRLADGSISLAWDKITSSDFSGYKVVASATNPNPVYPADGYIRYITERNTTSMIVGASYLSKLTPGTEYYFSVTVLYGDRKVPGNAIRLKYLDEGAMPEYKTSTISGTRLEDGSISLTWEGIDHPAFSGYKVVASATNPNPSYPDDGYVAWITDKSATSLVIDDSYGSKLTAGTSYYFSITVLYCDHSVKKPGNSVYLQYK